MSFYVSVGGQQQGPLPESVIIQRLQAGELRDAMVCAVGQSQWAPIASHPAFAQALQGGSQTPPPGRIPGADATAPRAAVSLPQSPPAKKTNWLMLAGAGCGGLMLLSLVAAVVVYFVAIRKTDPDEPKIAITADTSGKEANYVFSFETRSGARVTVTTSGYRVRSFRCTADGDGKCKVEAPVADVGRPDNEGKSRTTVRIYHDRWTRSWQSHGKLQMPPVAFKNRWDKLDCYGMSCRFEVSEGNLVLRVDTPTKLTTTLGGNTGTGRGSVTVAAPLGKVAGGVPVREIVGYKPKGGFNVAITLATPEQKLFSGEVMVPYSVIADWLKKEIQKKPFSGFSLGKDDTAPSKPRGILWFRSERSSPSFHNSLVGSGTKLSDADLVATGEIIRKRNISCGRYVNRATGYTTVLKGGFATVEITLSDRRTGKKVASQTFTGRGNPCPERTTSGAYLMMPDTSRIESWLEGKVR